MRSLIMTVALAATLIAGAGSALAKGLSQATIEGPGITTPIRVPTGGDPQTGGPLNELAERSGFFTGVFDEGPNRLLSQPPSGDLGPRFTATWVLPGPNGDALIQQHLYPHAARGPVTYMPPGQPFFETERTSGGWYQGNAALFTVLEELGVSKETVTTAVTASPTSAGLSTWAVLAAVAVLLLLATAGLTAWRSRRRPAVVTS